MTIKELAMNWIENADTIPGKVTEVQAADYIAWMDPDSDLPEDLTPESFAAALNEIIEEGKAENKTESKNEEEETMEKTLYTAMIETETGIRIYRKSVSDDHGAYENFEYAMQDKADELEGELLCIYCPDDIVEDVTLPDDD